METSQNNLDVSESLDRSFNFSEVFQLVKRSVKTSIGRRRTGLMLGLADLPDYIGAFHQMGSNFIVMNRSLLDQITHLAKDRRYINAYVFYTLLHEYLHTLGYADEGDVRRLTRQICARILGPDHPATRLAVDGPAVMFPEITFQHHGDSRSSENSRKNTEATWFRLLRNLSQAFVFSPRNFKNPSSFQYASRNSSPR